MNLALNSRDAMPRGGMLTISTSNVTVAESGLPGMPPHSGGYVLLRVSDTGSGIAADALSKVFEPFFTTKEPGKGTGLGLATVYGIVEQSGGSIFVESQPGAGAAFTIFLPRWIEPAEAQAPIQF
jgi:two-component system cell cycle sensor histidine kinase/response regulator CckA